LHLFGSSLWIDSIGFQIMLRITALTLDPSFYLLIASIGTAYVNVLPIEPKDSKLWIFEINRIATSSAIFS